MAVGPGRVADSDFSCRVTIARTDRHSRPTSLIHVDFPPAIDSGLPRPAAGSRCQPCCPRSGSVTERGSIRVRAVISDPTHHRGSRGSCRAWSRSGRVGDVARTGLAEDLLRESRPVFGGSTPSPPVDVFGDLLTRPRYDAYSFGQEATIASAWAIAGLTAA